MAGSIPLIWDGILTGKNLVPTRLWEQTVANGIWITYLILLVVIIPILITIVSERLRGMTFSHPFFSMF